MGGPKEEMEVGMEWDDHVRESGDPIEAVWSASEYCKGPGFPKDPKQAEEFLVQELMATRANRGTPLSKSMLMMIFLVSMLLAGIGVLLFK